MALYGIATTNGRPTAEQLSAMLSAEGPVRSRQAKSSILPEIGLIIEEDGSTSLFCDDAIVVACEAELYNEAALRAENNCQGSNGSIAELIAQLYRQHGEDFIDMIDGVFAIALWDRSRKRALLMRDRFGIRVLAYAETKGGLVFGSHPKGIPKSGLIPKNVNYRAIVDYLNFNVVPAPRTAYVGISKLGAGERLLWERERSRTSRYWQLQYTEEERSGEKRLAQELFLRMEEAVRVSSKGIKPETAGCFLSGGTDSSSICGLLTRVSQAPSGAFSIGFAEERFDELLYADIAAKHFGLRHFTRIVRPEEAYDLVPKIVDIFDEPFSNASAIPTYACTEFAKSRGVSIMFAGDGGDELFGGNERYRVHQVYDVYQRVPRPVRGLLELGMSAIPFENGFINKVKAYIKRSNIPNPERYCRWRMLQVFSDKEVLGSAMPSVNGDSLAAVREHYRHAPAHSELNRLLYVDIHMALGDEDLPKVIRTAESNGIRVRFPYLDRSLAEFSGRLPARMKVKGFEKRYLFKRATQGFLPPEILRKKKHGFGLPIGIWLKTNPKLRSMLHDVLFSPTAYQRGYYRKDFIEKLMANMEQDDTPYYGDLLWVFLMLELWHRRHIAETAL